MPRILRTPASKQDYNDIYSYIAADSPNHAANLLRKLDARLKVLSENNLMGRRRPELAENLRTQLPGRELRHLLPAHRRRDHPDSGTAFCA
jgi:plasmid stabilization system protein ParE